MIKLFQYFGVFGILSILAWIGALVMVLLYVRSQQRTKRWWTGFGLAVLGLLLAHVTFLRVTSIEVDRRAEQEEGTKLQKDLRRQEDANKAEGEASEGKGTIQSSTIRFAEDTEADVQDLAGKTKSEKPSDDYLADIQKAQQEEEPAYRKRGKQERVISEGSLTNNLAAEVAPEKVEAAPVILMKEPDAIAAKKYGRANYLFARMTFWFLLSLVLIDYMSRFNRTFDYLYPLPVANGLIDAFWPKKHSVHAPGRRGDSLRGYLEDVVRKRETFIYFGPRDLWDGNQLPRLAWRNWWLWPMRKIACKPGDNYDSEFICESAWFGRYCFVVANDPQRACRLTDDLVKFLSMRYITRARARCTVHVVWDLDPAIAAPTLEKLAGLAPEINFKLLVTSTSTPANVFDEVIPA